MSKVGILNVPKNDKSWFMSLTERTLPHDEKKETKWWTETRCEEAHQGSVEERKRGEIDGDDTNERGKMS